MSGFGTRAVRCAVVAALIAGGAGVARADGVGSVHVHGMLDDTASTRGGLAWNWDSPGASAFDAYAAHLLAEDRVSPHFEVDGHAWYREETGLRLLGA